MLILRIVELGLVLIAALLLVTQMIIPAIKDDKLFPMFRNNNRQKNDVQFKEMNSRINDLEQLINQSKALEERIKNIELEKDKK